jgi:hypothetical protein
MVAFAEEESDSKSHLRGLAKGIILAQAAIILAFTVWMYQEYLNNVYLQEYVINVLRSGLVADSILSMVTISIFALGTFTLLGSMRTARRKNKDWNSLSEPIAEPRDTVSPTVLETVIASPKPKTTRRRSPPKPKVDSEQLYRSMVDYAYKNRE